MTDSPFRAALWSAVSSAAQAAEDKGSLSDQIERERSVCSTRGWRVMAELIVPGHSREYASLDAAMRDIHELARLLELSAAGTINLLLCYDVNRFRGLQTTVFKSLARYGVQIYSLNQPVEPVNPRDFKYYASDTQTIVTAVGSMTSDIEMAALRRRYAMGMPRRTDDRHLHFNNRAPFGYRKPAGQEYNRKAVLEIVPAQAAILLEMKRRYEAGESASAIAAWLHESGIASSRGGRWTQSQVLYLITNPWYAGLASRNRVFIRRDPLTRKITSINKPRSEWKVATGKHQALWSVADYERLWELREQRNQYIAGVTKHTGAFSRLVVCLECGRRLYLDRQLQNGQIVYACRSGKAKNGHGRIYQQLLVDELRTALSEYAASAPPMVEPEADPEQVARATAGLVENDGARVRYQRLYASGRLSDADYDARLAELDSERAVLDAALASANDTAWQFQRALDSRQDAQDLLAAWDELWSLSEVAINARLVRRIDRIEVKSRKITQFLWRE